jgi:hypothetical protein
VEGISYGTQTRSNLHAQWSLSQLEQCAVLTGSDSKLPDVRENYELVGGFARWALGPTSDVLDQVHSAINDINFDTIQHVMATLHLTTTDEKELVQPRTRQKQ